MASLATLISSGSIRSVYQPIVDLDRNTVVGYEALARGPQGSPLESPAALFAAARAAGCIAELDAACRIAAFRGALENGLRAPLTLFVNVEPEVLDEAPLEELLHLADSAPRSVRVVFEITERAVCARPAELLRTVERIRGLGWGIALDDVGADAASIAFMPLLCPEVVKLDRSLVQDRPGRRTASVMHAVNAYAEASGALVLAEGIENEAHLRAARGFGARLGQGWLYGRPLEHLAAGISGDAGLPRFPAVMSSDLTPFACLAADTPLRHAGKRLLIELSRKLEREALAHGETAIIAGAFQEALHFTPRTARMYQRLAAETAFACAIGSGLAIEPTPGVRGAALSPDDIVRGEWDVVVLAPHFAAALLARDLGDDGPDLERRFEYALTYRRDVVVRAACALLSRVVPALPVSSSAPLRLLPRAA